MSLSHRERSQVCIVVLATGVVENPSLSAVEFEEDKGSVYGREQYERHMGQQIGFHGDGTRDDAYATGMNPSE